MFASGPARTLVGMLHEPEENKRALEGDFPLAEHRFARLISSALRPLARLEGSPNVPYLTVALDLLPIGSRPNARPALAAFERRAEALVPADANRVRAFLAGELSRVRSVYAVACEARQVFETRRLAVPIPECVEAAPAPILRPLAIAIEDNPPYLVVSADQRRAILRLVVPWVPAIRMRRELCAEYHEPGEHFAKRIVDDLELIVEASGVTFAVLAVRHELIGLIEHDLDGRRVEAEAVAGVALDVNASEPEVIERARAALAPTLRRREERAASLLRDRAAEGKGVAGAERVLDALEMGDVDMLVIGRDVRIAGWADYALPLYGAGPVPGDHPAGGDPAHLVAVDLAEELLRLAARRGADIVLTHDATVGATVRGAPANVTS